jgi:hypothetical protein
MSSDRRCCRRCLAAIGHPFADPAATRRDILPAEGLAAHVERGRDGSESARVGRHDEVARGGAAQVSLGVSVQLSDVGGRGSRECHHSRAAVRRVGVVRVDILPLQHRERARFVHVRQEIGNVQVKALKGFLIASFPDTIPGPHAKKITDMRKSSRDAHNSGMDSLRWMPTTPDPKCSTWNRQGRRGG